LQCHRGRKGAWRMVGTWVEGGARNVKGRGFGNVVCYCTMRGNRFAGLVKGGGMYLHMQLSPDFWYGQPKRLASGETTAASFALRCELIEVRLPLRPKPSRSALWLLRILHANMRPTSACLAPGFIKRSLDEFKRLSNFGELCSCVCACAATNSRSSQARRPAIAVQALPSYALQPA
jgi:hypothetical protein